MKQRLLVMNGQRIVQEDRDGSWTNRKVDKAGAIKPGIYNVYTAKAADKTASHDGQILHVDSGKIYQKTAKAIVMHSCSDFDKVPDIGSAKRITYNENGKAEVRTQAQKAKRSRSL